MIVAAVSPTAWAGPIGLVDNFSGNLSSYTATRILKATAAASDNTFSWQITGGAVEINTTAFGGIEQYALTRTDYSLGIGEELRTDFRPGYTGTQDIGLYVGAGHPTPDVRANYVNVYVRNNGQIFSRGFNGTTEFALAGGATPPAIDQLYITRTSVDTFALGYIAAGVKNQLTTRTIGSANAAGVGSSIGLYADVRSTGIVGNLDNLRLVPEPAACMAALVAALCVAPLRRRA
jgi:hypothetical protein